VRTGTVRIEVTDGREAEGLRILEVDEHCLREAMTRAAVWLKRDTRTRDGHRQVNAPMEVVETYRSRVGRWGLPVLAGVVTAPTLRRDGSVLDTPGYDAATGLLFDPCGASFPPIPRTPARQTQRWRWRSWRP
jgi:putative DNA primase/helicase